MAERYISSSLFTEEDDLERESSKYWGVNLARRLLNFDEGTMVSLVKQNGVQDDLFLKEDFRRGSCQDHDRDMTWDWN